MKFASTEYGMELRQTSMYLLWEIHWGKSSLRHLVIEIKKMESTNFLKKFFLCLGNTDIS